MSKRIENLRMRDLKVDELFQFSDHFHMEPWIYHGNGWYSNRSGYAGGPWHQMENVPVYRVNDDNERVG